MEIWYKVLILSKSEGSNLDTIFSVATSDSGCVGVALRTQSAISRFSSTGTDAKAEEEEDAETEEEEDADDTTTRLLVCALTGILSSRS